MYKQGVGMLPCHLHELFATVTGMSVLDNRFDDPQPYILQPLSARTKSPR